MIQSYFQAEKTGGQIALAIGIAACSIGGGILLSAGAPFYTGLAIPLVVIGIIQVMVGATVARRSDRQAEDLEKLQAESAAEFRAVESPRMARVLRSFTIYKAVELALLAMGLALILLNKELNFSKGLGAGLFAQSVIMLVFDYFAEKRGKKYAEFVEQS
jgi:cytochrome c biogenesis factor